VQLGKSCKFSCNAKTGHSQGISCILDHSWQTTAASDLSLCVDAGDMSIGNQIILWECQGYDQQSFGYDGDAGSIYLAQSGNDASLCLKPEGAWNSAAVTVASCDNQDNGQQWSLTSTLTSLQAVSNHTLAEAWI